MPFGTLTSLFEKKTPTIVIVNKLGIIFGIFSPIKIHLWLKMAFEASSLKESLGSFKKGVEKR